MSKNEDMKKLAMVREQVNNDFLLLTPEALDALRDIMNNPEINPIARVQAIGLILDRGLGKAQENIRIQNADESMEAAQERLDALFMQIREETEGRNCR